MTFHSWLVPVVHACEVFKQRFHMAGWGGPTPKPSVIWSNSRGIGRFATSSHYARPTGVKLVKTWVDKHGKKRFQGNGRLKSSETLVFKTEANHTHVYIYMFSIKRMFLQLRSKPKKFGTRFARSVPALRKGLVPPRLINKDSSAKYTYIYPFIPLTFAAWQDVAPAPTEVSPKLIFEDEGLFQDLWKDARMWEVLRYLRGGVGLQLPPHWRERMT